MQRAVIATVVLLFFAFPAVVLSFGIGEDANVPHKTEIEVTGRVTILGSEPHTYVALLVPGNQPAEPPIEYRLFGDDTIIRRFVEHDVTVIGTIEHEAAGPEFPGALRVRIIRGE